MRFRTITLALAGISALSTAAAAQDTATPAGTPANAPEAPPPASAPSDQASAVAAPGAAPATPVSSTAPPVGAGPENGLADIVVTAQRREESLQKVPVAVTALSAQKLDDLRVVSANSLSGLAPSLTINNQGLASNPTIIIRGISSGVSNNAVDPKVAVYLDGVYIGRTVGALFDLADIQRIEVLRGPQGTLFGRNATGGALSIVTAPPKGVFGVRGSVSYGNYDAKRAKVSIDLPSFGPFSARVSYLHDQSDGDVKNQIGGQTIDERVRDPSFGIIKYAKRFGARNTDAGQVAIRGDFGAITADYHFDYSDARNVGRPVQAFGVADDSTAGLVRFIEGYNDGAFGPAVGASNDTTGRLKTFSNATSREHVVTQGHSLTLTAHDDDAGITVKNIIAYRKFNQHPYIFDLAATGGLLFSTPQLFNLLGGNIPGVFANPPGPNDRFFTLLTSRKTSQKQISEEFQVLLSKEIVDLTAGVFIFHENSPATDQLGILEPTDGGVITPLPIDALFGSGLTKTKAINDSFAGYAQGTLHVTPTIDLTLGGRYTYDDREADIISVAAAAGGALGAGRYKVNYEKFTYAAIATWHPAPQTTVYGKFSTGYVAGGILSAIPYKPETLKTAEVGFKGQFFDNRVRTNLAAYYSWYDDLQIQNFVNGSQTFENAGKAHIKGFEAEIEAVPVNGLTLTGNFSVTDFTYVKYRGVDTLGNVTDIADIARTVYAPKYQARGSAQYDVPPFANGAHLFARVDATYRSKISLTSPAYVAPTAVPGPGNPTQAQLDANADALNAASVRPSLLLIDARAGIADFEIGGSKVALSAFGKNLTDKHYVAFGAPVIRLVGAREMGRTYGVELGFQF